MKILKIGRSSDNNIIVNDAKVSRLHLQIVQNEDEKCYVVDLNSTNGTFVNGVKINGETRLHTNDEIRVGDTVLPWQYYIAPHPVTQPPIPPDKPVPPSGGAHISGNSKQRLWFWVMGCIVFVLLLGSGGVVWKIYSDSKVEREKFLFEKKVNGYAKEQTKKDKEQAETAKKEAEAEKDKAIAEKKRAEEEKRAIEKQLQENNKALEKLFRTSASALTSAKWMEIAKELGISDVQENEAKGKVEQEFKKKDSALKMRIINIMESVKNRPVNENNKHLEQQQADTTVTTKKQN